MHSEIQSTNSIPPIFALEVSDDKQHYVNTYPFFVHSVGTLHISIQNYLHCASVSSKGSMVQGCPAFIITYIQQIQK